MVGFAFRIFAIVVALIASVRITEAQTIGDPGFPIVAMRQLKTHASTAFPTHIPELPLPFASVPTEMVKIQNGQVTVLDCALPANPSTDNYEICDHAKVSFDGQWVYYAKFTKRTTAGDITNSSDIYKINLTTLQKIRLTFQEFTPNTGVKNWGSDPRNSNNEAGKFKVNHGVFNMHPVPVPFKNGQSMVAFVSTRDMFGRSRRSNSEPATRIYIGHDYGVEGLKNVRNIDYMFFDLVGRLNILSTGKLVASYLHTQGLHHLEGRASGVWEIDPDGRAWSPRVSGLDHSIIWRGETETASREIISVGYYQLKNAGMGSLIACPTIPPAGQPQFGFSYPRDSRNSMKQFSFPCTGGRIVTPFGHIGDEAADKDASGQFMGKITNAAAAPGNRLLAVWSGNSPANNDTRPVRGMDAMRIVMFGDKAEVTKENYLSQLQVLVYDPNYHYMQPISAVPYKNIYGIDQPAELPWLPNDGSVHTQLPTGTPYGLIGTASFLNNYRDASIPSNNEGVTPRGFYSTQPVDTLGTPPKKIFRDTDNWAARGADNGYYTKDDIFAVRIVGMNAFTEDTAASSNFIASHETEQLTVLGEIPLRKFDSQGNPILDDEGNPDTSFLAKIPADQAFTFQTLDKNGMVLNMAQTWHQVRPGEGRWDCGGCHGHSTSASDFKKKAAAKPDYQVVDLTKAAQLLVKNITTGKLVPQTQTTQAYIPEFNRDIKPILQAKCVQCHHTNGGNVPPGVQPGGLDLANFTTASNGHPVAYNKLVLNNTNGALPGYFTRNVDDYNNIKRYGARESYLIWKLFGARQDGFTNADLPTPTVLWDKTTFPSELHPSWWDLRDRNFTGTSCPPPGSGIAPLTEDEKLKFIRWIDMGLVISKPNNGQLGYDRDDAKPVIALASPKKEKNFGALTNFRVGMTDYCPSCQGDSLDMSTFSVKADFAVNGKAPGTELAAGFAPVDDHIWAMNLSPAITSLARGTLTVRIKDKAGNLKVIENIFSVSSGNGPEVPANAHLVSEDDTGRSVTLAWTPVTKLANGSPIPPGSIVTYKILIGPSSGQYSRTIDVGQLTQFTVNQLSIGNSFIVIKAKIQGLSEEESQSQEIVVNIAGPIGGGSNDELRPICLEWNSFLTPIYNIQEASNFGVANLRTATQLFDLSGTKQDEAAFGLTPGTQFDMLVHDLHGWAPNNSYGLVCSKHDGTRRDDLNARMVVYRPDPRNQTASTVFQFAYSSEPSEKTGDQFVFFNTFQPSLASRDAGNLVANWIQVTNRWDGAAQSGVVFGGELIFYDLNGAELLRETVQVNAGARQDVSGHKFGPNRVGIVRWKPFDTRVPYQVRNVRYVYDNPGSENSFETAFQLEALQGSSQQLVVPIEVQSGSAILEIGNTSFSAPTDVTVKLYGAGGQLRNTSSYRLGPNASQHIITDTILGEGRGVAVIQGAGIIAVAMQYARRADNSIYFMYGLPAKAPTGVVHRGSYNTFLDQDSELWTVNLNATSDKSVTVFRSDGTAVMLGGVRGVPTNGLDVFSLSTVEQPNHYGVVTVQGQGVVGWLLRRRGNEYVLPTPLRSD